MLETMVEFDKRLVALRCILGSRETPSAPQKSETKALDTYYILAAGALHGFLFFDTGTKSHAPRDGRSKLPTAWIDFLLAHCHIK